MQELDECDLKILKLIQNNARMSVKAIAEKVYISAPTVASRIENMVKNGIIKGYHTEINPYVFGNFIKAYIDMEVKIDKKEELYEYLKVSPQVIECSRVTGDYSLLMQVLFKNTDELDKFINHLQQYGRTKTSIVFSTIVEHRGVLPENP